MVEADRPGKLFIGGLNAETTEKTLEAVFGKHGPIGEVLLMKDRDTHKSRGFAFITFENPVDAKSAIKNMNGKSLDGKMIKVEQANKPSFESGGRRRSSLQRNRGTIRSLRGGRGRTGGARGRPSRGGHLGNVLKHKATAVGVKNDDGGYSSNVNISSRGSSALKRGPSSRSRSPPPRRSAASVPVRSSSGMGRRGSVSRGRENYGDSSRREPISSRRDDYVSPRDDGYSTKNSYSSRHYPSSRNTKDYAVSSRDYRDYGRSSSRDEHSSRGYSDRDAYSGSRDRDYSELASGGTYRSSYESYGSSRGPPPARETHLTYRASSRYDDYTSTRDGYGGNRENYSNSRNDIFSIDRVRSSSRRERGFLSSFDRVYSAPRESYDSSSYATSRGSPRGCQSARGFSRY